MMENSTYFQDNIQDEIIDSSVNNGTGALGSASSRGKKGKMFTYENDSIYPYQDTDNG